MNDQIFELKGEMSLLNVLLLHSADMQDIEQSIHSQTENNWALLERSPVIVDCQQVKEHENVQQLDFARLRTLIATQGMVPVGIRNLPEDMEDLAVEHGWPLLRAGRAAATRTPPVRNKEPTTEPVQRLKVIERPVRSGQQVYCPDGDIVVMQQTSAGSELLAGGSVHVYGALRGRVLAGVQGDTEARIFCQQLEAELIAIAGRYRLLEDIEADLQGQAVMVYLDGEKLKIVPI